MTDFLLGNNDPETSRGCWNNVPVLKTVSETRYASDTHAYLPPQRNHTMFMPKRLSGNLLKYVDGSGSGVEGGGG